jgi:23S rRNA A2030 N6-methylase RlmJ
MNITEQLTKVEDTVLEGLTTLQTQLVDVNTKVAERVQGVNLPIPEVEPVIPPAEAVARYYDFAGKVMTANRKFAEQVVSVWYPAKAVKKTTAKASK